MWWPMGDVAMQRSALNFYDGPVHMKKVHVEVSFAASFTRLWYVSVLTVCVNYVIIMQNYTDGLSQVFCNTQPSQCNGGTL